MIARFAPLLLLGILTVAREASAQQTRIPVGGVDPARGFCTGTLDVSPRADKKLDADLQLEFRGGSKLRVKGPLEPQGGTRWRAEFKVNPGVTSVFTRPELGIVTLDVDPDAGLVKGRYSTGPGGVVFQDAHKQQPVLDQRNVQPLAPTDPKHDTTVQVRYFGAAGYHVKRGADEFLFAPFLSTPSFGDVSAAEVLGNLRPNVARIDEGLAGTSLANVRAILVGHGHYDHLMDVPPVARKHAPNARIFCNKTSQNILAGEPDAMALLGRTDAIDPKVGQWMAVPGARIRVMPLASEHPDHLGPIQFYKGHVDRPRMTPPRKANDFKCGSTFAFLVDFLDASGRPVYRIYYQDAATSPGQGTVAASVLAERRVDLAIYCMSLHKTVKSFPQALTKQLDPRVIVGGHWEDIFSPMPGVGKDRTKPLDKLDIKLVLSTKPREFARDLNEVRSADSRWLMPLPGSLYRFP